MLSWTTTFGPAIFPRLATTPGAAPSHSVSAWAGRDLPHLPHEARVINIFVDGRLVPHVEEDGRRPASRHVANEAIIPGPCSGDGRRARLRKSRSSCDNPTATRPVLTRPPPVVPRATISPPRARRSRDHPPPAVPRTHTQSRCVNVCPPPRVAPRAKWSSGCSNRRHVQFTVLGSGAPAPSGERSAARRDARPRRRPDAPSRGPGARKAASRGRCAEASERVRVSAERATPAREQRDRNGITREVTQQASVRRELRLQRSLFLLSVHYLVHCNCPPSSGAAASLTIATSEPQHERSSARRLPEVRHEGSPGGRDPCHSPLETRGR